MSRTIAIGDVHGELAALDLVLARLPPLDASDTLVFLGDYVDRGPDSRGVVARVRELPSRVAARVVCLRGNHEDAWLRCAKEPDPIFLFAVGNGCAACFRSFTGEGGEGDLTTAEARRMLDVAAWFPKDVLAWFESLPLWYEDEHAIYVHAGLDGEGTEWRHPRDGRPLPLLWMREPDFFRGYAGKRVVFGHTQVDHLPLDHAGPIAKKFDDPNDVWLRGDLVGVDTGCGKGGFLSAFELPSDRVYESR